MEASTTDLEILVETARGNKRSTTERHRAFSTLVQRFQDMVFGYSYSILGDFHLAEDAAQESFLVAYQQLDHLQTPRAFPGWLRQIVFSQCNRQVRRKHVVTDSLNHEILDLPSDAPDPSDRTAEQEMKDHVLAAIRLLPDHERTVTTLFYINGYSQQEIAAFLEVPITTVQKRMQYARQHLKRGMLKVFRENLDVQRPSRHTTFASTLAEMLKAVSAVNIERVQALLNRDASLATSRGAASGAAWLWDQRYWTPMHRATMQLLPEEEQYELIDLLLTNGADINAGLGTSGWQPLHMALAFGSKALDTRHMALAQYLIDRGARMDIFAAAGLGDAERVQPWIDGNSARVHKTGPDGATPLHFAATVEVAEQLLVAGADLNRLDTIHHSTPLRWRVGLRWRDLPRENTVAQYLIAQGATVTDIFLACALDDQSAVHAMLEAHPELGQERTHDRDLLRGNVTALQIAVFWRLKDMAALLLDADADIEAYGLNDIKKPLITAAFNGDPNMVDLLLHRGAQVEAHDDTHDASALHWVVYAAHFWWQTHDQRPQVVQLLTQAGIDPNIVHPRWGTSLHLAAQCGQIDLVNALLSCGAHTDIRNTEGKTAKQLAGENGYDEVAKML
jgi:RNA polymerase sigma factor (sigma-70 family)